MCVSYFCYSAHPWATPLQAAFKSAPGRFVTGIIDWCQLIKPPGGPPHCEFPCELRQYALRFYRFGYKPFHL
ncbi:hypothetical protein CEQ36_04465 [Yersinia intermedia]|nr:hypothetical protein A6J67_23270 [Yersinia sp. FDAARGOS_228]AVL34955.1 hypothetical protein CEQ36_04465 [Yersinia intermedia]